MKIYHSENLETFSVRVAFLFGEKSQYRALYNFATKEQFTVEMGQDIPPECYMDIPRDIWEEFLKGFAELANDKGIKLESDTQGDLKCGGSVES